MRDPDEIKPHFDAVVSAFRERNIIPFLGAGASLCDRGTAKWTVKQSRILPSTTELTKFLARRFKYPSKEPKELTRVSQYVDIMRGLGPLYDTLNHIFDKDYELTSLHRFLASLPSRLKNVKPPESPVAKRFILITTNYDDLLERAFNEADPPQPYHKLVYMADKGEKGHRGHFLHWMPDGGYKVVDMPTEYGNLEDHMAEETHERYPAIIKIHGAVDRDAPESPDYVNPPNPSYVITEDHYIDFLMRADISSLLPRSLVAALSRSHFLFLGYGLRDWNLRVILRRIWQTQTLGYKSWAIQLNPGQFDEKYWQRQEVEIINMDIGEYVRKLQSYMGGPHV